MNKTLIIGSNGFIGSHFKPSPKKIFLSRHYIDNIKVNIDLSKQIISNLPYKFDNVKTIIHLAGISHHGGLTDKEILNNNINITKNIFNFFKEINASKMIFISSGKVYGHNKGIPIKENDPLNPYDIVGRTKIQQEEFLYKNSSNLKKIICVRLFNAYGKNQGINFVISKIISSLNSQNLLSLGNVNVERDFIYIKDIIKALELFNKYENDNNFDIFNLSTSKATSIKKIIDIVSEILNKDINFKISKSLQRNESTIEIGCNKKIKGIGWNFDFDIYKGLRDLIN